MSQTQPLSPIDFHVLLVLAEKDLYGYAILKSVVRESGGAVEPEIGSLYRVLSRLMAAGLVEEAPAPTEDGGAHRGRPRRYYHLTDAGARTLEADARRLEHALFLAKERRIAGGAGA
ncbi:MAG: PadR family transcriptional regulator [Gemmatimonadota bacterium]|nr:PadR family transcriptional regulator [Gemmatimonadota bacterium]